MSSITVFTPSQDTSGTQKEIIYRYFVEKSSLQAVQLQMLPNLRRFHLIYPKNSKHLKFTTKGLQSEQNQQRPFHILHIWNSQTKKSTVF